MKNALPQHEELWEAISILSQETMVAFPQRVFFFQWVLPTSYLRSQDAKYSR